MYRRCKYGQKPAPSKWCKLASYSATLSERYNSTPHSSDERIQTARKNLGGNQVTNPVTQSVTSVDAAVFAFAMIIPRAYTAAFLLV